MQEVHYTGFLPGFFSGAQSNVMLIFLLFMDKIERGTNCFRERPSRLPPPPPPPPPPACRDVLLIRKASSTPIQGTYFFETLVQLQNKVNFKQNVLENSTTGSIFSLALYPFFASSFAVLCFVL